MFLFACLSDWTIVINNYFRQGFGRHQKKGGAVKNISMKNLIYESKKKKGFKFATLPNIWTGESAKLCESICCRAATPMWKCKIDDEFQFDQIILDPLIDQNIERRAFFVSRDESENFSYSISHIKTRRELPTLNLLRDETGKISLQSHWDEKKIYYF